MVQCNSVSIYDAAGLLAVTLLLPALSPPIVGKAEVLDGDTFVIGRVQIRFYGIDAPEAGQKCKRDNGKPWKCGKASIEALAELAEAKEVRCEGKGWDRYDRLLAVCHVGETDINAQMVLKGMAWAFVKYAQDYAHLEKTARTIGAGTRVDGMPDGLRT